MRSRSSATKRRRTSRPDGRCRLVPEAVRIAREDRAHGVRAALCVRRGVPRARRRAEPSRALLAHRGDGGGAIACDGAEPARRRGHRRPQPAHRGSRAACRRRCARGTCSHSVRCPSPSFSSPSVNSTRSCAGCGRSPSRCSSSYPYLKRVTWLSHFWLGAVDGLAPVGGWVAVTGQLPLAAWLLGRRGGGLGGRLRPPLRPVRHRGRSARGAALVSGALRRSRGVLGSRVPPCRDRALLLWAGAELSVDVFYWLGVAAVASLLAYEQRSSRRATCAA